MGAGPEGIGVRAEAEVSSERRTLLDGLLRVEATATLVRGPARVPAAAAGAKGE